MTLMEEVDKTVNYLQDEAIISPIQLTALLKKKNSVSSKNS